MHLAGGTTTTTNNNNNKKYLFLFYLNYQIKAIKKYYYWNKLILVIWYLPWLLY